MDGVDRLFDQQWQLAVAVLALLGLMAVLGDRRGRRLSSTVDDAHRSQVGAVQATVLGILGLLLGFTFSMGVDRYDQRRGLVLEEANAIGTTWLRANLLPEPHRQPVRSLLENYIDIRLRAQAQLHDSALVADDRRQSQEIQSKLWQHAEASAQEAPNDITATFIETLNELIDTDARRVAAARGRIPSGVWLILMFVSAVGCWITAYAAGTHGVRSLLTKLLLPLLITVVMVLIYDLTHERRGIVHIIQQPLIDLRDSTGSGRASNPPVVR